MRLAVAPVAQTILVAVSVLSVQLAVVIGSTARSHGVLQREPCRLGIQRTVGSSTVRVHVNKHHAQFMKHALLYSAKEAVHNEM